MHKAACPTLQELPAELRLKIYEHISPPISLSLAECQGLFISCKKIHHEMKYEIVRNMARYTECIKTDWARIHHTSLQISTPISTNSMQKVTVLIPNSYFRARRNRFRGARTFPTALLSLLRLSISQLTIGRFEDEQNTDCAAALITEQSLSDFMRDIMDLMEVSKPRRTLALDDGTKHTISENTAIGRIVFEWGLFDDTFSEQDLILPYYAGDHASDRTVELTRDPTCGRATGATWTRRPYTWYGCLVSECWKEAQPITPK